MRRKDRQVTDFNKILEIVDECEILRIGLADGELPYIVPLNFAYLVRGKQIEFYVHGAMAGRKYELMNKHRKCTFEMDIPLQMECILEKKDVTMRYKSVMGAADIEFLEGREKQWAIDEVIMKRCDATRDFEYNHETLNVTAVARLTVIDITAKANLA
ncbi:MAG: pyridoxamine 5'-phosphate oxidase family protein [Lachnospiraceae bacterium]|nr:pyridoxamine 5'-phosphate oxidase family protein [Lachnospiraceae bacterium]